MNNGDDRKWYKKKRYLLLSGAVLFYLFVSSSQPTTTDQIRVNTTPTVKTYSAPLQQTKSVTDKNVVPHQNTNQNPVQPPNTLSNDNYYVNTYSNTVHSPAYAPSIPAGASAKCRDGTYSFSQSRRGTCSHHGGVAIWY